MQEAACDAFLHVVARLLQFAKGANRSSLIVLYQSDTNLWRRSNDRDASEQVKGVLGPMRPQSGPDRVANVPASRPSAARDSGPRVRPGRHSPCPCPTF